MTYVRRTLLGLVAVLLLLVIWGVAIEPRFIVDRKQETAIIPDLPPGWEARRVASIADFQVGMWLGNTGMVRQIVRLLAQEHPDLVLIAGDFIYRPGDDAGDEIREALDLIAPLTESGIPVYAVLGNHDYAINWRDEPKVEPIAHELNAALEHAGVRVLHNTALPLPPPEAGASGGTPLYLVGIGSHWADEDRPEAALGQVPRDAPRLIFMHNPESFKALPAGSAPLALAAHTHGRQVRLPFLPRWSWLNLVEPGRVPVDGWVDDWFGEPGNRLYVNRGIGFGTVPIRINCPPEVTVFTLHSAKR